MLRIVMSVLLAELIMRGVKGKRELENGENTWGGGLTKLAVVWY